MMSTYPLPYLALTCLLFFLYLGEQKRIKILSRDASRWTAYIIMWMFIGLRGHIMSDFIVYMPFFESLPDIFHISTSDFLRREEPGFIVYTAIIKIFTNNYFIWVAFNSLIDFAVFAWFFRKYCNSMILPLIFFIAFNGLLIEFNLYRNVKAIDLFLISIPFLQKRKTLPYMILNIIGISFHISALLFIPLYFVLNIRFSKYVVWTGFIISNIIFLFNLNIIGELINSLSFMSFMGVADRVEGYVTEGQSYSISFGYIERTISFILFYSLYRKVIKANPSYIIFYNCFWIYYCSTLIFYEVTVLMERIPYLFMFSYWLIYPQVLNTKNPYKNIINIFVTILVIMKIAVTYNSPASQYETCIFSNPDYDKRKKIVITEIIKNQR